MIPAPFIPYAAGGAVIALALGAWTINDRAVERTEKRVNAEWQQAADLMTAAFAEASVDAAILREAQRTETGAVAKRVIERTRTYYATRPADRDAVCLPADRMQSVLSAREAIFAAADGDRGREADAAAPPAAGEDSDGADPARR